MSPLQSYTLPLSSYNTTPPVLQQCPSHLTILPLQFYNTTPPILQHYPCHITVLPLPSHNTTLTFSQHYPSHLTTPPLPSHNTTPPISQYSPAIHPSPTIGRASSEPPSLYPMAHLQHARKACYMSVFDHVEWQTVDDIRNIWRVLCILTALPCPSYTLSLLPSYNTAPLILQPCPFHLTTLACPSQLYTSHLTTPLIPSYITTPPIVQQYPSHCATQPLPFCNTTHSFVFTDTHVGCRAKLIFSP